MPGFAADACRTNTNGRPPGGPGCSATRAGSGEWCANRFHPYPGFRPFPYPEYSLPWFDGRHYVLKGGSRLSEPEVQRPAFRNYYTPATRHILSGVRLAFDGSG